MAQNWLDVNMKDIVKHCNRCDVCNGYYGNHRQTYKQTSYEWIL